MALSRVAVRRRRAEAGRAVDPDRGAGGRTRRAPALRRDDLAPGPGCSEGGQGATRRPRCRRRGRPGGRGRPVGSPALTGDPTGDWVRSLERADQEERWTMLCFLAGRRVTLAAEEANGAVRRAELLLAAGG